MHELQCTIEHAAGYIWHYYSHNNLFKKIKRTAGLQGTLHIKVGLRMIIQAIDTTW